ncbi:Cof-type HAD-IIB family hydrolase [Metabacillus dongyingensis]|uniref:Cof-type HAD-IIB family hydrolase n=1 Tax=Metabacillus dongyingensis TaxID=2874282 RepID=UPI001CBED5E8|nr:Cof-type HAD-IIB family hydrolase [Metabacillus dongyingensis]UAL51806.1 Cof-type HAD-IIB family hydrolase [Metabacillus dongyingensis]
MSFIAIDLDGTLLNDQNEISEENIKAIQYAQDRGFEVVISTGRAYFDVQTICKKAGISPFVIGTNGATIHSKSGKCISSITITKDRVESILQWLDERNYYYEVFTDKAIYTLKKGREHFHNEIKSLKSADLSTDMKELVEVAERQFDQFGYVLVENYHDILKQEEEFYNILACSFDKKKLEEAWNQFKKFDELMVVSSADHNIEMTSKSASKGTALEKLAFSMNGSLEQAMAIGDSNNDLSMFQKVGYSVAMGNAKDVIKTVCTTTTLKNDENGVAYAIYRYMENFVVQK